MFSLEIKYSRQKNCAKLMHKNISPEFDCTIYTNCFRELHEGVLKWLILDSVDGVTVTKIQNIFIS